MTGRYHTAAKFVVLALPLLALVLWLSSGREFHTKPGKVVAVQIHDELFGDTTTEYRLVRGPLFGYYVGTDVVVAGGLLTIAATAVLAWWGHRRARAHPLSETVP